MSTACCDFARDDRDGYVSESIRSAESVDRAVAETIRHERVRMLYVAAEGFDPFKKANRDRVNLTILARLWAKV